MCVTVVESKSIVSTFQQGDTVLVILQLVHDFPDSDFDSFQASRQPQISN